MTKGELLSLIHATAKDDSRSLTARIRDHMEDIETALAAGFKRAVIVDALGQKGIIVTVKQLEQILYRERRKKAEEKRQAKQNYLGTGAVNPQTSAANQQQETAPRPGSEPAKSNSLIKAEPEKKFEHPSSPSGDLLS